jgi:FdhE protein
MKNGKWDIRIRRASELAAVHQFAAEGLCFYERLVRFQKSLYAEIESACGRSKMPRASGALRREFDPFLLLPRFAPFLSLIEEIAPSPLSRSARELGTQSGGSLQELLLKFWEAGLGSPANLEPANALLCGGKPQVGALRPEGDGGKRSLICSLCATEWTYRRIVCPACGEEDVYKLAVYSAPEFDHVRVEACDACHSYIKTVDLTKNGNAVPVVDELATIPLNLWASEHGYLKLQHNFLGI